MLLKLLKSLEVVKVAKTFIGAPLHYSSCSVHSWSIVPHIHVQHCWCTRKINKCIFTLHLLDSSFALARLIRQTDLIQFAYSMLDITFCCVVSLNDIIVFSSTHQGCLIAAHCSIFKSTTLKIVLLVVKMCTNCFQNE